LKPIIWFNTTLKVLTKPKPTLTFAPFGSRKAKQNECFIACQNSRLSMCSTKSNDLIGLFSNSTVAFKTNYLMLNNLLALTFDPDSPLVVNQRSWSGLCINVHWPLIITY
jgi:hypothetical protein